MNITSKFMKVWEVKESNGYTKLDLGDSRKDKDGEYEHCTWFNCLLLGEAAKKEINKGDTLDITSGQIFMRKYNDNWYTEIKIWHLTVTKSEENKPSEDSKPAKALFGAPPPKFGGDKFDDSDVPF